MRSRCAQNRDSRTCRHSWFLAVRFSLIHEKSATSLISFKLKAQNQRIPVFCAHSAPGQGWRRRRGWGSPMDIGSKVNKLRQPIFRLILRFWAETLWRIGRICDVKHELDLARVYLSQAQSAQTTPADFPADTQILGPKCTNYASRFSS